MKIEVYGSAREIVDLVFALQGRQEANEERFSTQTISDRHLHADQTHCDVRPAHPENLLNTEAIQRLISEAKLQPLHQG